MASGGNPFGRGLRGARSEVAELARAARASSRAYGGSAVRAARRARHARSRGFEWDEMRTLGLLDPALAAGARTDLVSTGELRRARNRVNPPQITRLARDRAVFSRLTAAAGLPSPALYGLIGATTGWSRSGRIVAGAEDFAAFLAEDVPEEFVVKACARGAGPWILRRREGLLTTIDGATTTPSAVLAAATATPGGDLAIVQERLRNHPSFDDLGGPETLRTVRIVTLVQRDCSVRVLAAILRLEDERAGDRPQSSRHRVLAEVDVASGRIGSSAAQGFSLPGWSDALGLVRQATGMMLPARTIAWDVALTPDGPALVDAEADYPPWPTPSARAVVGLLETAA